MQNLWAKLVNYFQGRLWTLAWFITATLLLISIVSVAWQNYKIDREIAAIRAQIEELEQDKVHLQNLISYLKTDSFKEREARRKLNYQKPGESVLLIPQSEASKLRLDIVPEEEEAETKRTVWNNLNDWVEYLFR